MSFHSIDRARPIMPLALAFLLLAASGCSSGPKFGKVSGKVSFRGQPVTTGTITFYPESGRPAIAQIGPDGTFTLTTNTNGDGAQVGNHKVTIHATKVGAGSIQQAKSIEDEQKLVRTPDMILVAGTVEWLVPEKYSREETSTLTAIVQEGSNTINFDISE